MAKHRKAGLLLHDLAENLSQELLSTFLLKLFSCGFSHVHEEEELSP